MPTLSQISETVEKILQQALANAVAPGLAATMTEGERLAAVAPFEEHTKATMGMLRECLEQASLEGAQDVHRALHSMPGVDAMMLDEAVEYAPKGDGDGD